METGRKEVMKVALVGWMVQQNVSQWSGGSGAQNWYNEKTIQWSKKPVEEGTKISEKVKETELKVRSRI